MTAEPNDGLSELAVLMRVLDIMELRLRSGNLQNTEYVHVTHIANQFMPGATIGKFVQDSIDTETIMGDKFEAHGQARVGNMGNKARIEHISFGDAPSIPDDLDLAELADELKELRAQMRLDATTTEQDEAVVAIGQAIVAAEKNDSSSVGRHLKAAGRWALGIATTIGTGVALAAIKAAAGL